MCGSSVIHDESSLIGFTLDDVKADGSHPALMGFILAEKARKYVELSREERKQRIAQIYSKVFNCEEACIRSIMKRKTGLTINMLVVVIQQCYPQDFSQHLENI